VLGAGNRLLLDCRLHPKRGVVLRSLHFLVAPGPVWFTEDAFKRFTGGTARKVFHDCDGADALILGINVLINPVAKRLCRDGTKADAE
jgi:hypothetical protein